MLNNKGAKYYQNGEYEKAAYYYHLASSMGNSEATSNLGYCYLYGRHTECNPELAIALFKISANEGCIDSMYKLGDIYSRDKWVTHDKELSNYYYEMAANEILDGNYHGTYKVLFNDELERYPSLCFALGREMSPGGSMLTDCHVAYQFLLKARKGYEKEIENGNKMYQESYVNVLDLLKLEVYDSVREQIDLANDDEDLPF